MGMGKLGSCMLEMQLQEGSQDTAASKHEASQGPQGAKGIRHHCGALDEIRVQDDQEEARAA